MLLILSSLVFYRSIGDVDTIAEYVYEPYFGFQEGGTFFISVNKTDKRPIDSIFIGLATMSEMQELILDINLNPKENDRQICDDLKSKVEISDLLDMKDTDYKEFDGNITETGLYQTLIYSCEQVGSTYHIELYYKNPKTLLDSRLYPCLYTKPIIAGLFALLLIIWLINWFMNFSFKNSLHVYITLSIIFTFVYLMLHFFTIYHDHKSDDKTPLSDALLSFKIISESIILSALLLACKGWCIIVESLPIRDMIIAIVFSIVASLPLNLIELWGSVFAQYILMLIGFCCFTLYFYQVHTSIDDASSIVLAHLLVIAENGIDITTTPIYSKFNMFRIISTTIFCYITLLFFRSLITEMFLIPQWISYLIYDTVTLALMGAAAWIFKLKKLTANSYMMIGEETSEPRQFTLDDIDGLNINSDTFRRGGMPWEEGIPLPSQPIVYGRGPNRHMNPQNNNENDIEHVDDVGSSIVEVSSNPDTQIPKPLPIPPEDIEDPLI